MSLIWRSRLIIGIAAAAAMWFGTQLAGGALGAAAIFGTMALAAILMRLAKVPVDALMLGALLFGYLVGNRGFAQLMPVPELPLLPAEIVLLVACFWIAVRCAIARRLPFQPDALNWMIFLWLLAGTGRVYFDVRTFGVMALRDYAMIYYAVFFYLAQHIADYAASRRFLLTTLVVAAFVEPFAAIVSEWFPEFLFSHLTVRGVPLILFKGDLVYTFMGVSAFLLAFAAPDRLRWWTQPIAIAELIFVIGGANRASMMGALVALGWLWLSRARRFVHVQLLALTVAVFAIGGLALLLQNPWAEEKVASVTDRVRSLGDFVGSSKEASDESAMKGDNNRFRTVWWRSVADETLAQNPAFGLGFGYDLARAFLEEYNPEMAEDFSARSPHSIVVSAFGRMGFVGLALFAGLCAVFVQRTWRAMRHPDTPTLVLGLWACIWTILVSACFGVVLEGPMGAVVFWSLLGLANAIEAKPAKELSTNDAPAAAASLEETKSGAALPTAGHSA